MITKMNGVIAIVCMASSFATFTVKAGDISHKSRLFHEDHTTGIDYCVNTFTNKSCKNYYVCNVQNSSSYALGVGPKQRIEISSICGSAWECQPADDPHAGGRLPPKNCKEEDGSKTKSKLPEIPEQLLSPNDNGDCRYFWEGSPPSRPYSIPVGHFAYWKTGDYREDWDRLKFDGVEDSETGLLPEGWQKFLCTNDGWKACENSSTRTECREYYGVATP